MNTKIATTFGLALMLALGVFATMLALGLFSPSEVRAEAVVTAYTAEPEDPSAAGKYVVTFTTTDNLQSSLDTITIRMDDDFKVPSVIDPDTVKITANYFTNMGSNTGSLVASPVDVTVVFTGSPANDPEITLTVPDMDPTSANPGNQDILGSRAGATTTVTVTFTQLAGITNPTADKTYDVEVKTSQDTSFYNSDPDTVSVRREVTISSTAGSRGKVFTVSGKAFSAGGVATIFIDGTDLNADGDTTDTAVTGLSEVTFARDLNCDGDATDTGLTLNEQEVPNGVKDATDREIGKSDASVSGGTFEATVTADTRFAVGKNAINAQDSDVNANTVADDSAGTAGTDSAGCYKVQKFDVNGTVSASPSGSAARGQTVTITLSDWANGALTNATFGGVGATLASGLAVSTITVANNNASFDVTVPAAAPLGALELNVKAAAESTAGRNTSYEVTGVPVTLSPSTAVANQKITINGQGFSTNTSTTIESSTTDADDLTVDGTTITRDAISVDSSGNVVFTVTLPNDASSTRTPGNHTIRVEDSTGRVGEATLTVPDREITVSPTESRRDSTVTVTGSGFVASTNVTIDYGTTTTGAGIVSVVTNAQGSFTTTFKVPTIAAAAPIPSTNTVTATSAGTGAQRTATAVHQIPAATITVSPLEVSPGDSLGITGQGFPGFSSVASITVGGVTATPAGGLSTSGEGSFDTADNTVLVPQLTIGTQAIVVTAGDVSANTSITIIEAAAVVVVEEPAVTEGEPASVFSEAVTADPGLQVWGFTNGEWGFFDASLDAAHPANSMTQVTVGDGVWMLNNTDADITVTILSRSLTLTPGWNLKGL